MRILLDTNVLLWAVAQPEKLGEAATLIAQAKSEGLTLLTADRQLQHYHEPCVRCIDATVRAEGG